MTENQTPAAAAAPAPTAAQIRTNHERARKVAEKLTGNGYARVTALCNPGQPAVLVAEQLPWGTRNPQESDYFEVARITTGVDQKMGTPVNYSNRHSSANMGTMCYRVDAAEQTRQRKLEGLRSMENAVTRLKAELAHAEERVAARRAELGL